MDNFQGNVSTIAVAIYAILAPYIAQYISQDLFLAIVGVLLVLWSAYNPNSFKILGNDKPNSTIECEEPVLNDEYEVDNDGE